MNKAVKQALIAATAIVATSVAATLTARVYVKNHIEETINANLRATAIKVVLQSLAAGFAVFCSYYDWKLMASIIMLGIIWYNTIMFFARTVPTLFRVHKELTGVKGYVLKHFLRIAIWREIAKPNIILSAAAIAIVICSRFFWAGGIQLIQPWIDL